MKPTFALLLLVTLSRLPLTAETVLLDGSGPSSVASWRQSGGEWKPTDSGWSATAQGRLLAGNLRWRDYDFNVRMITEEAGKDTWNTAVLFFRYLDDQNHYMLQLHANGKMEIIRTVEGKRRLGFARKETSCKTEDWHEISIKVRGGKFSVQVDGEKTLEVEDPEPISKGGIALGNNGAKKCSFENVKVISHVVDTGEFSTDRFRTVAILEQKDYPVSELRRNLEQVGLRVKVLSKEDVCRPNALSRDAFFLYLIPDSQNYPAEGMNALTEWLELGGHLMTFGGPPFQNPMYQVPGSRNQEWMDKAELDRRVQRIRTANFFMKNPGSLAWSKSTDDENCGAELQFGILNHGEDALTYRVKRLNNWATFATSMEGKFSDEDGLLCMEAMGEGDTGAFLLELAEKDGSRWITTVVLEKEWKKTVIPFGQFQYWHDSPTKTRRGQLGDSLRPADISKMSIGLARANVPLGGQTFAFSIRQIGPAPHPFPEILKTALRTKIPVIEGMSPSYKLYPISNASRIAPIQTSFFPTQSPAGLASSLLQSPFPRPLGQGFSGINRWRWVPLQKAVGDNQGSLGTPASVLLHAGTDHPPGVTAMIGLVHPDPAWIASLVKRIHLGLFFFEGGSDSFTYDPGESGHLGARIQNSGSESRSVLLRFTLLDRDRMLMSHEAQGRAEGERITSIRIPFQAPKSSTTFTVRSELVLDGAVIDEVVHDAGISMPSKNEKEQFIQVKGGDFWLRGKKFYINGMNYWPRDVAGLEPGPYNEGWLTPGAYSPDMIESDLRQMKQLGINVVSIQMQRTNASRNLRDFLRRCSAHGLFVNGFLDGANPTDPVPGLAESIIREGRLKENPTLFAYDIAWEAGNHVFNVKMRSRWDPDWNTWIADRYGNLQNAVENWGFNPGTGSPALRAPSDKELSTEGPWIRYVAAYRRFMDDFTSRAWNRAHRRLRAVDPNHLISFRQGNTLPYDFGLTGPVKHIDFVEPEGYSIKHDDDGYDVAGFITRYVRFTAGGKPVYWAEFGMNIWNTATMSPHPKQIIQQGQYHEKFYRVALEAGAQGLSPWWWPGGYRVNEKSDYGVLHPDGRPRPAAEVIRIYADRLTNDRTYPEPNVWHEVDRDSHPGGYWNTAFHSGRAAFSAARSNGMNLGIRSSGTGTTSLDTPLMAIGNVPCNGNNPPKYLNAEFNRVSLVDPAGQRHDLFENESRVRVPKGKPIRLTASVGNLGEAKWLASPTLEKVGHVYLSLKFGNQRLLAPIARDVPRLEDAEIGEVILGTGITSKTEIVLEMVSHDRARFGEKWTVTLIPE